MHLEFYVSFHIVWFNVACLDSFWVDESFKFNHNPSCKDWSIGLKQMQRIVGNEDNEEGVHQLNTFATFEQELNYNDFIKIISLIKILFD